MSDEMDRLRVELLEVQHEIGEGWFAGGVSTAEALRRKTRVLEEELAESPVRRPLMSRWDRQALRRLRRAWWLIQEHRRADAAHVDGLDGSAHGLVLARVYDAEGDAEWRLVLGAWTGQLFWGPVWTERREGLRVGHHCALPVDASPLPLLDLGRMTATWVWARPPRREEAP